MCMFSGVVQIVSSTQIFARPAAKGWQYVVYSMIVAAKEEVAMILPIPTPPGADAKAVHFISLKGYPDFFDHIDKGFDTPSPAKAMTGGGGAFGGHAAAPLPVVKVGEFEASFVPAIQDFARLDKRFQLPSGIWDKLPAYKQSGFAVFKLKAGHKKIHPMAFEFVRRDPKTVFFPTVHIHDGEVHDKADFDHVLYLQPSDAHVMLPQDWQESPRIPTQFMDLAKTAGIVQPNVHIYRHPIHGEQKNEDYYV